MSKKLVLLSLVAAVAFLIWRSCNSCHPKQPPNLDLNEWWGPPELKTKQDTSVRPFKISFTQEMVTDLKNRLSKRRKFTPPLEGVGFEYGFNTQYLEKVLDYWQNKYDFTKRQEFLNKYPQFKTNIQGLDIHYIRVKPEVSKDTVVLPLLLLHGWPGSVREFYEIIPLLTTKQPGRNFVFEVIVPSLPGYGYSDGAKRTGLSSSRIAVIMRNLLHRLGFTRYYIQGGDWGSVIVSNMAILFPNEVLGHHSNMPIAWTNCNYIMTFLGSFFPSFIAESHLIDRMYPLSKYWSRLIEEMGYFHLQATKPDTLGVGLADSPSGLAAYILEKFSFWTDHTFKQMQDGGITKKYTLDQLLDNIMMYWTPNSMTTAMRLYAEEYAAPSRAENMASIPTPVPTWVMQAKYELFYQPAWMLKNRYTNLLNATVLEGGGHFIAFEQPAVVAEDIFKAVNAFQKWQAENKAKKTEL